MHILLLYQILLLTKKKRSQRSRLCILLALFNSLFGDVQVEENGKLVINIVGNVAEFNKVVKMRLKMKALKSENVNGEFKPLHQGPCLNKFS